MGKHRSAKKKRIKYSILALAIVFFVAVAFLILNLWDKNQGRFPWQSEEEKTIVYNGEEYVFSKNVSTFLVLGLDKYEGDSDVDSYNNDNQADFLMLLVYDNDNKQCTALHINRDTMADVNRLAVNGNKIDTLKKQIALAHTYGNGKGVSCRNTADSVSMLLQDVKIDHYLSLKLDAVPVVNDRVGGVTVEVLDDFTGIDDDLIVGNTVTLTGDQALTYVRTRYGLEDNTNSGRMERQKQYLDSLYSKFKECAANDNEFIVKVSMDVSDYLVSDCSITQLQNLADKFLSYEFTGIQSLKGESVPGERFMAFYPDEDELTKTVVELFCQLKNN